MIRIARLLKVRQMTAHAGRRRPRIFPSRMARRAIERCVHTGEREPRNFQVIKIHALPVVDGMALLTLG